MFIMKYLRHFSGSVKYDMKIATAAGAYGGEDSLSEPCIIQLAGPYFQHTYSLGESAALVLLLKL